MPFSSANLNDHGDRENKLRREMTKSSWRWLLFLFLLGIMTACAFPGQGNKEVIHTYLLSPESVSAQGRGGTGGKTTAVLLVNQPQSEAGFETERMAYLLRPHEVSYYATHEWADAPARMLTPLLVQAFEQLHAWQAVVQMPSAVRGDYRFDSDHFSIAQEFFQRPSHIRLTLRAELVDLQRARPIGTKSFEIVEEAPSEDAYGGVLAANRAVAKLLEETSDWLRDCMEGRSSGSC